MEELYQEADEYLAQLRFHQIPQHNTDEETDEETSDSSPPTGSDEDSSASQTDIEDVPHPPFRRRRIQ